MSRKPWEIPIQYTDDMPTAQPAGSQFREAQIVRETDEDDIRERMSRPDDPRERDQRTYECNDTTPIDYGKGPHDDEYDLSDARDAANDPTPVDYAKGPHEDEFGVDDEDEAE